MSVRILSEPRSNGSRGPLPMQLDWLDHRLREATGAPAGEIPFHRPGWVSPRHWEAFRKAVERGSTYTVTYTVRPTIASLRRYIRHLESSQTLDKTPFSPAPVEVEESDVVTLLRGLSELELRQHAYYRGRGWMPWALTEQRGTNIVVTKPKLQAFRKAWKALKENP